VEIAGEDTANEWCEAVIDKEYKNLLSETETP
jgi:hypothetical protein